MAKKAYKIPSTLADDYLHMEIALQTKDGIGIKPLPARVIIVWVVMIMGWFLIVLNDSSVISETDLLSKAIFTLAWFGVTILSTKVDKSHRMRIELIPTLLKYVQKSNRHVLTRRTENAGPFAGIVGIEDIDPNTGMVTYLDGTYGYWYSVVGTASVLLFPEDRDMIIDHVDDFYKKLQCDCEVLFMTTKQPQKIVKQAAYLIKQYDELSYKDKDIDKLVDEQYNILTEYVGKEFRSIHQYLVIKGDNREALGAINSIVQNESYNSSLMYKHCVPMYKKDIEDTLRVVYSKGD